jgi:hypothetical protein
MDGINFIKVINGRHLWTSLMDGINGALMDGIHGPSISDGINGRH